MSTDYPVLDNRPINKWKVVELKEELKRRNLMTKGLKDELVRRLSEAIHEEMEAVEDEESKGPDRDTDPGSGPEDAQPDPNPVKLVNDVQEGHHSEVPEGINHGTYSASGLEDTNPTKFVDDIQEHQTSETIKGIEYDANPASGLEDAQPVTDSAKSVGDVEKHHQSELNDIDADVAMSGTKNRLVEIDQDKVLDEVATGGTDAAAGEVKDLEAPVGVNEIVSAEVASTDQLVEEKTDKEQEVMNTSQNMDDAVGVYGVPDVSLQGSSALQDVEDMKISSSGGLENDIEVTLVASKETLENNSIKLENEGFKLSGMDVESDVSNPTTQVHEVKPNLGSQVKSDSFSTDTTLPINENKDLNDNLNADNVKIETEVRQEMELQSSSNKDLSDFGSSHPLDDQMPHEMLQGLVGETDDLKSSDVKFSMKNDNADQVSADVTMVDHGLESKTLNDSDQTDVQFEKARTLGDVIEPNLSPNKTEATAEEKHGIAASDDGRKDFSKIPDVVDGENMEKINLDQSDDSMEEDIVETKHVDFDHIFKDNDKTEEPVIGMREEPEVRASGSSDGMQLDSPFEKVHQETKDRAQSHQETKDRVLSEKRKFQAEVGAGSKEPPKRQRRWNTESLKTAEPQNLGIALSKNLVQTSPVKPILGRTNSTAGGDAPKERTVPKSSQTATTSLKIENFVRPFTLKAAQELLARSGEVCAFWMDQIKTHCYVTYSSVEEAIETRNAVYNLQWPPNGGRLLVADFVDPEEVQAKVEGREPVATPKSISPPAPPSTTQTAPTRHKQQVETEHPLSRQPPIAVPATKERVPLPVADKNEAPIVTLDDLFRKTKATPRIYYLPLTDEEVAEKLAKRGNTNKQ